VASRRCRPPAARPSDIASTAAAANRALYLIALSCTVHDPRTRAYIQRRTRQDRTKREILRCLKRYIARELYKILTRPQTPAAGPNDLPVAA
jgi:hypothetical protein